jgi:hypothetical protein
MPSPSCLFVRAFDPTILLREPRPAIATILVEPNGKANFVPSTPDGISFHGPAMKSS